MPNSYNITIFGRIPSKKNSKVVTHRGGLIPSKKYRERQKLQLLQLPKDAPKGIISCDVFMVFHFPDNRRTDLTNKAESVMDLLVDAGILTDDSHQVVKRVELVSGGVQKNNPACFVCLSKIECKNT